MSGIADKPSNRNRKHLIKKEQYVSGFGDNALNVALHTQRRRLQSTISLITRCRKHEPNGERVWAGLKLP